MVVPELARLCCHQSGESMLPTPHPGPRRTLPRIGYDAVLQTPLFGDRARSCPREWLTQDPMRKTTSFRRCLFGLSATFADTWGTELTGSMIPLALGASVTLMCTAPLVKDIWTRSCRR